MVTLLNYNNYHIVISTLGVCALLCAGGISKQGVNEFTFRNKIIVILSNLHLRANSECVV